MESIIGSGELEVTARPVQIFAVDEQCRLVTKCLDHFVYLLADITVPIRIINIIGDHFSGKSFLMNLLINYLKNDCKGLKGDVDSSFKVSGKKCGKKYRPLNVVRAYPEIFIRNSPNGQYGIMLMDTQGLFDGKHSNLVPVLFKICKTLSSVTILNVKDGQLLSKTLQNVVNHSDDKIPNNTDLMLLMRDQFKQGEIPFSVSDLSALIPGDSFNDETINELRSKFKNVSCFSLAQPSNVSLKNQFRVDVQKLSPKFVKAVNGLFAKITAVDDINLLLTGKQLLTLFRSVSSSDSIKWKILSRNYLEIMKSKSSQVAHVVSSKQGKSSLKGANEPRRMMERAVPITPAWRSNDGQRQSSSIIAADVKPQTSRSSITEPLQETRSYDTLKRECRNRLLERMYSIQDVLDLIDLEVDIIRQYWPDNYSNNSTDKLALQRDLKRLVVEKAMDILKSNCERKMKTDIDDSMLPTLEENFQKIFNKIKDESVCKMRKLDPSSVDDLTTELRKIEAHYKAKNEEKWNLTCGAGAAAVIGTGLYMLSGNKRKEQESRQLALFNLQPVVSAGSGWGSFFGGIGAIASMVADASKNPSLNKADASKNPSLNKSDESKNPRLNN